MKTIIRYALVCVFLPALSIVANGATADYFPLAVGNTWVYKVNSGIEFTLKVVGKEVAGGRDCFVIEGYKGDKLSYREHRARVKGKDLGVDVFCAATDKIFEFSPPRILLQSPLVKGLRWFETSKVDLQGNAGKGVLAYSIEAEVVAEENLEVPAGKFRCYKIKVNETNDGISFTSFWWYSSGVGWVKKQYLSSGAGVEEIYELERYKAKRDQAIR